MAQGLVISTEISTGRITVDIIRDTSKLTTEETRLQTLITSVTASLVTLQTNVNNHQAIVDQANADLNQAIGDMAPNQILITSQENIILSTKGLIPAKSALNFARVELAAAQKDLVIIQAELVPQAPVSIPISDSATSIAPGQTIGIAEIDRIVGPGSKYIALPSERQGFNHLVDPSRDGINLPILGEDPYGWWYNTMIVPSAQIYAPRYALAEILTKVDGVGANNGGLATISYFTSLDFGTRPGGTQLGPALEENVPFDFETENSLAFFVGDKVLVELIGSPSTPTIIGFGYGLEVGHDDEVERPINLRASDFVRYTDIGDFQMQWHPGLGLELDTIRFCAAGGPAGSKGLAQAIATQALVNQIESAGGVIKGFPDVFNNNNAPNYVSIGTTSTAIGFIDGSNNNLLQRMSGNSAQAQVKARGQIITTNAQGEEVSTDIGAFSGQCFLALFDDTQPYPPDLTFPSVTSIASGGPGAPEQLIRTRTGKFNFGYDPSAASDNAPSNLVNRFLGLGDEPSIFLRDWLWIDAANIFVPVSSGEIAYMTDGLTRNYLTTPGNRLTRISSTIYRMFEARFWLATGRPEVTTTCNPITNNGPQNLLNDSENYDPFNVINDFSLLTPIDFLDPSCNQGTVILSTLDTSTTASDRFRSSGLSDLVIGQPYTFSAYFKRFSYHTFQFGNNFSFNLQVTVDLVRGTITEPANSNLTGSAIESIGNGWFRISVSFLSPSTAGALQLTLQPSFYGDDTGTDGTNGFGIFGMQINEGSAVTPYLKTTIV